MFLGFFWGIWFGELVGFFGKVLGELRFVGYVGYFG